MSIQVLLLGGGAALHALAWKLVSEPQVEQVHCAPGNAGTALLLGPPPFSSLHGTEVAQWAFSRQVDLIVLQGWPAWTEILTGVGLDVLGAGEASWQASRSRQRIRQVLRTQRVPFPAGGFFSERREAERYLASRPLPLWMRLDDAAPWEAVRVTDRFTAFQELARLFSLAPQGGVCIEEEVAGPTVTMALLTDGRRAISVGVSRPYDHRYEGDTGPLTEGMGAYAPYGDRALEEHLMTDVGRPVVAALAEAGLLRPAFLHLRITLGSRGPVLRDLAWGLDDLHAAVTLPLWDGALAEVLLAAARGRLEERPPQWRPGAAVAVTVAAAGYPGSYAVGQVLAGLYQAEALVFHHATRLQGESDRPAAGPAPPWLRAMARSHPADLTHLVVTAGARVLLVVGSAATVAEARRRAYAGVESFPSDRYAWRKDIAEWA